MADRHLEAATNALIEARGYTLESVGSRADFEGETLAVLESWVSSLLGELPEEAVKRAVRAYRKGDLMPETIRAFLISLRDSLASGTGQQHEV